MRKMWTCRWRDLLCRKSKWGKEKGDQNFEDEKLHKLRREPWWMRRPASVVLRIHRGALARGHALSTIQFAETIRAGCLNLCNLFILEVLGHVGSLCVTLRASRAHNMRRFFCMLGAVPWEKCGLAGGGIYFAESPSEARRKGTKTSNKLRRVPWWMRRPASVVLRIHRGALARGHALSTIQFAETIRAGCLNLCNLFILEVLGHVGSLCVTLRASHAHNMRRFFCMLGAVPWEKCGLAGGGIYFAESPSEARRKAHQHGAMKVAHWSASESHDHLKRQGFDSVKLLGRDSGTEYIMYNWDQVTNIREV